MTSREHTPESTALAIRTESEGDAVIGGLEDPRQAKKTARIIRRAARERWVVGPKAKKRIIKKAQTIAIKTRDAGTFTELLKAIVAADKVAFEQLVSSHRIERLEAGESTENHAHRILGPDQLNAAADAADPR